MVVVHLVGNSLRGILAEFLVAQALGCTDGTRAEWDAYDLCTSSGVRVEVKTSGYVQTWPRRAESRPSFNIAAKRGWDAQSNTFAPTSRRSADVYVFAMHAHRSRTTINPLDVSQWDFCVVPTAILDVQCGSQKTIGLVRLRDLSGGPVAFEQLADAVLGATRSANNAPEPTTRTD
jgi:hypothetical protein